MAKKDRKKKKKSKGSGAGRLIMVVGVLLAVLFLPTTVMLMIGMVPTLVLLFVRLGRRKSKVVTVGAANFAGCAAYVFELWFSGQDIANSLQIVLNPRAIMMMYGAAAIGYAIDWGLTGIVAGVMREKGKSQLKAMRKRQADLVDRWGQKVSGDTPLGEDGFPLKK